MFYPKQKNLGGKWTIICISPEVLWKNDCSFFEQNAASSEMRYKTNKSNLSDFEFMFNINAKNKRGEVLDRSQLKLPESQTTDPQAEVLVANQINAKYITDICFPSISDKNEYSTYLKNNFNVTAHYYPNFFNPRKDYLFWKNN
jgi:hypothetical protein